MASFSGLGIGLSFVFGCILMGLVAELYYLLWVYACMGLNFVEFNCFCIGTFQFAEDAATCIPWGATGAWAFNDGAYNALQISPGKFDEKVFTTVLTRKNTFYRD
nr:mannan endo-1,4-beta-mannosidase 2-like isoform X2 [Ipomoea batatas]